VRYADAAVERELGMDRRPRRVVALLGCDPRPTLAGEDQPTIRSPSAAQEAGWPRRLRVLGSPAVIEDDDRAVSGAPAQPKSLALLGLLAAAGARGLSRDRLVAFLWPETSADRAAHRLAQLVYSLRRELGTDALFHGSTDLRINSAALPSDLDAFREALTDGDPARAVAAYGGPFLDGFHLGDAAEFERWQDEERAGLAAEYARALEAVATAAERRGDHARSVAAWRRLVDLDPLSAGPVTRCIDALAASGDLGGAVRVGQLHDARMREELGRPGDPRVASLLERLRAAPAPTTLVPPAENSLAVLPFVNLSADSDTEYFSDGMTEELTNAFARIPGLRVASRTSAFAFKGRNVDVREIGERLRVATVVEGSVRKAGGRIRITAQVVSARDGYHLWSDTFERTLDDVFRLQHELSSAIAAALPIPGAAGAGRLIQPPTASVEAYTSYLRGRYYALRRTPEDFRRAIEHFARAVQLDPAYALAHAGLGECHALSSFEEFGGAVAPCRAMPAARACVIRALELDPMLPEARLWGGTIAFLYDYDWVAAEAGFRRAIELKPAFALAHTWYGVFLLAMRRFDEAIARARHAIELDPMALTLQIVLAHVLYCAGRYDESAAQLRAVLEVEPGIARAYERLARVLLTAGRPAEAWQVVEDGLARVGPVPPIPLIRAMLKARAGEPDEPLRMLAEMEKLRETRYVSEVWSGAIYRDLGMPDEAVACFERAYAQRAGYLPFIASEPSWAVLHGDPRFRALAERLGLPAPPAA
jgi:TolB-like protein/Tfp pilus assembly protein PilF